MSSLLCAPSSCISRKVFPYRGQFDLLVVAGNTPVSVWDSAKKHLNGALGHRIFNREEKRGVRKSSPISWPPSSPPPLCPKLIKSSTLRWWVTESTSVRQSHAEMMFHVPGLGTSLSSPKKSWSQRWAKLWQPARERAHCVPLTKGKPFL